MRLPRGFLENAPTLLFGMKLLLENIGREVSAQQGTVGYDSLLMVDKGHAVDSSCSIEAEYSINALVVQSLAELRPV